jgi:hypothetical protein
MNYQPAKRGIARGVEEPHDQQDSTRDVILSFQHNGLYYFLQREQALLYLSGEVPYIQSSW